MPTVFRYKSYVFFFWSNDRTEPIHIHIRQGGRLAKFWIDPVRLSYNEGFRGNELRIIEKQINFHLEEIRKAWYGFFA